MCCETLSDLFDMARAVYNEDNSELPYCLKITEYIKRAIPCLPKSNSLNALYWKVLLWEAPNRFESFLLYMEKNRPYKKKFYEPRMNPLSIVAQDLQDLEDGKYDFYGLSMPPRVGKAIAYDTPVLTKNGWKKHGDLTIRDSVIGIDGEYKKILAIHNPCEMEYEVTFSDGEKIVCHGNHEWVVEDRNTRKLRRIETKKIAGDLRSNDGHFKYRIPKKKFLQGDVHELAVDPYTLGVWLGDGRNQNPDICGAESDYAIVQAILDNGYELAWDTRHKTTGVRYYGFKELRKQLQEYDMCHSRRRSDKYIPDNYLTATVGQRLELLAGLLDTDGCLRKKEHRYDFTTNEERLRDDVISLVSTFGWRCSVVRYERGISSSGIRANKPYWVISFNPTCYIPCRLERKQLYEFSKQRAITITDVEKIHGIQGNCITVEGGVYCVGKRLKPTHNSSICIFYFAWIIGKRPSSHNAMSGHSGILADRFHNDLIKLTENEEYTFHEIFPDVQLVSKSSEKNELYYDAVESFATTTCRGIDGTWTGAVDISEDGYLYVDDLVRDRKESLSLRRLEGRYQDYLNILVDRKNDGSKELMVGTRWNVADPLGRIEKQYKDNPRYKFRKLPALNEKGESNFNYPVHGFSTEYYHNMRDRLDKNEWMAKFMQTPFVREGLLFPADGLRYYNGILPEGDHRVVGACDVAWGGGDSLSMPIGYEYPNGDVYIPSWIFNKGPKEVTIPLVTGKIIGERLTEIQFEANNGGDMYSDKVSSELEKHNYHCSCSYKKAPGNMEKMTKMVAYSGDVKKHFIFLDPEHQDQEYSDAMDELNMTVQIGDNEHDDAGDGITQLAMKIYGEIGGPAEIYSSPV